jgi:hypothetical protein
MWELENNGSISIGKGQQITMKASQIVQMNDHLVLLTGNNKQVDLIVEIKADFEKIPSEWHSTMIQMMAARYGGIINCYSNTKPFEPKTPKKKKWWQFWEVKF